MLPRSLSFFLWSLFSFVERSSSYLLTSSKIPAKIHRSLLRAPGGKNQPSVIVNALPGGEKLLNSSLSDGALDNARATSRMAAPKPAPGVIALSTTPNLMRLNLGLPPRRYSPQSTSTAKATAPGITIGTPATGSTRSGSYRSTGRNISIHQISPRPPNGGFVNSLERANRRTKTRVLAEMTNTNSIKTTDGLVQCRPALLHLKDKKTGERTVVIERDICQVFVFIQGKFWYFSRGFQYHFFHSF